MKLRSKHKEIERELPSFFKTSLNRLKGRLIAIANFLQQKTNAYSIRTKKIYLLVFIIVFITASSVVIVQSIKRETTTLFEVDRIKAISIQKAERHLPDITKTEYLKIQEFKNYIDSLGTTAGGRKRKDSLLRNRPHLMDSVNFLINLYLEQSKTSVK